MKFTRGLVGVRFPRSSGDRPVYIGTDHSFLSIAADDGEGWEQSGE